MPEQSITINRDQRDGLHALIRNHLGAIGDFWIVFEQDRDFAKAERLGLEFAADFRLLQDIGWSDREPRERYVLTMPAHDLQGALRRLLGDAVELLIESGPVAEESRREADSARRFQFGYEACKVALADLDSPSQNA